MKTNDLKKQITDLESQLITLKKDLAAAAESEEKVKREESLKLRRRGRIKFNLWYVDDYTFRERFGGGEYLTSSEILGSPDFAKGCILHESPDGLWENEDGEEFEIDSRYIEILND